MYDIFALPEVKFPAGFFWGSSTAGHQIEGDNVYSSHWGLESRYEARSGKACNSYVMFRDDINILSELEHQYYRMSIEWSRIEPDEGSWHQEVVDHYIEVLSLLKSKGIKVLVTLVHGTVPAWFFRKNNGFEDFENIKYFERYLNKLVPMIKDYVDAWNILNESFSWAGNKGNYNFSHMKAHARGYHVVKQYSNAPVSSAHAADIRYPYRQNDELDEIVTELCNFNSTGFMLHAVRTGELITAYHDAEDFPEAKNSMDYWSLNYYSRCLIDSRKKMPMGARFPHKIMPGFTMNEEMYPEGLINQLEGMKDRPVIITENGCSTDDDRFRLVYIIMQLAALKEAIDRGVDVKGYLHWSLLDNYEWKSFKPRFGLVHVDYENNFKRTPKPSAYMYREIIRNNGFNQDIIRKYLKSMPSIMDNEKI